jgi:hypothetical protein
MGIDLENHTLLFVILFVILVCIIIAGKKDSGSVRIIILLLGAMLVSYVTKFPQGLWQTSSEHMEEPREITSSVVDTAGDVRDAHMLINTDENVFSQYGNIGTSNNVDTLFQRNTDLDMTNVAPDDLDNSDFVQEYIQKGSSIFQPNTAQGVTASSSAYHSNFKLAQPGMYMEYSVPINPRGYNADEALARKQQHRASINKRAIDGAVRSTRNIFNRFFQNELSENEEREWWSAEAQNFETDFRPYY